MNFKDISTAPKDRFVLLACPSGYTTTPTVFTTGIMYSDYKEGRWVDHANDNLSDWGMTPTHWAELPRSVPEADGADMAGHHAILVAEVHLSHLLPMQHGGPWCREVLLYSGGSPHDIFRGDPPRVKLYILHPRLNANATPPTFALGELVEKKSGAAWRGRIVGRYSTSLTPDGYAVESDAHPGSVQIYPAAALRKAA